MSVLHSFLWPNNIPLRGWAPFCLSVICGWTFGLFYFLAIMNSAAENRSVQSISLNMMFNDLFPAFCRGPLQGTADKRFLWWPASRFFFQPPRNLVAHLSAGVPLSLHASSRLGQDLKWCQTLTPISSAQLGNVTGSVQAYLFFSLLDSFVCGRPPAHCASTLGTQSKYPCPMCPCPKSISTLIFNFF